VPTIGEQRLPGFNVGSWFGIVAPAHTPGAIVQRLYGEIAKILETAEMKNFLLSQGAALVIPDAQSRVRYPGTGFRPSPE
jgi:tripartite-type tricarboxylate transporter receptor subunit TctC